MQFTVTFNVLDLLFSISICIGITFSLLLLLVKRNNWSANRFLGLVLLTFSLWMVWVLAIDIDWGRYFPHWSWIPLQYSLTIGPLLYFYVRKLTQPEYHLVPKDFLHFIPLLLEQSTHIIQILESAQQHKPTYNTYVFATINPVLQLISISSVMVYLYFSLKQLRNFHTSLSQHVSNIYMYHLGWLQRLLILFGVLWLAWIPYTLIDYLFFQYQLGITSYYPLYLLLSIITIWIGVESFLRPELILVEIEKPILQAPKTGVADPALIESGKWLRAELETNLYYLDASLTLGTLAEALNITPHELSRIINLGTGQNFSDLINDYRVKEVIRKMQDSRYNHITLLGLAYDSGFNSKTTFNRTFKQIVGESPLTYKNKLKKETNL